MKSTYAGIFVILFVLAAALAVSGCSGGGSATPTPAPGASPTATQPAATGGTLGSLYDMSKVSWFEYLMSSSAAGMTTNTDVKVEFLGQEMHDGKMQNHMRTTTSVSIPGVTTIPPQTADTWTDPTAPSSSTQGADYAGSPAQLTQVGPDTITVPKGTFACTKYTVTMSDGSTASFWASSQAPVPIQYTFNSQGIQATMKLVDYGK